MTVVAALAVVAAGHDAADVFAAQGLGPGRGAWAVGAPEDFGLDPKLLAAGAAQVPLLAAERYCLVVVKDGVIVHESYYTNTSETVYESDSLGKTITAALVGTAIQAGLVDLDTPIAEYGTQPQANWSVSGTDFFPVVTLRHLLAQSSGYGTVRPGSKMTYDSYNYIQHISYAITAAVQKDKRWVSALDFASRHFATALGIPDLYAYDGTGADISAGGGQMVTCRDMARVGQLVLNRGTWLDAAGNPYQLGQPDFYDSMVKPAFDGVIDGYGFLTWLNTDMTKAAKDGTPRSHCCAPRWGGNVTTCAADGHCGQCCAPTGSYNLSKVPCDPDLTVLPEWSTLGMCSEAPVPRCANLSDPSEYVSKQNLGDSFPLADKFDFSEKVGFGMGQYAKYLYMIPEQNISIVSMGQSRGSSLGCDQAYDDGFTLSLIFNALRPALETAKPKRASGSRATPVRLAKHAVGVARSAGDRTWQTLRDGAATFAASAVEVHEGDEIAGSCVCQCPPDEGFGKCFNVLKSQLPSGPPKDKKCPLALVASFPGPDQFCPALGLPLQCPSEAAGTVLCPDGQQTTCKKVPGATDLHSASCRYDIPTTWPVGGYGGGCAWQESSCSYNPFYPP